MARGLLLTDSSKVKVLLGEWLELSPAEREERGLPATQELFAQRHKTTGRTIIRYKSDPITIAAFDAAKRRREEADDRGLKRNYNRVEGGEEGVPEPLADPVEEELPEDPALREFEEIRRELAHKARKGGQDLATYMKYFGKQILDAQAAAESSTFAELTDAELVEAILSMLGREAVEGWLAA